MDHLEILEVFPSCVWISSSMCLHLCCLNFLQLLLVLSHGPNLCFLSSSPPSIPHCPIAASSPRIFLSISRTEPVLKYCSIAKCTNFPFQQVLIRPKLIPNKRVVPFYPSAAICPDEFQNAQHPMFLPYLLVRIFKFIDLGCVGMGISWSFWISNFSSLYVSVHVQNLMKTAGLALELWRCWRIWFLLWSRIHGNALSCLQNNSSAQSTPEVTVGRWSKLFS